MSENRPSKVGTVDNDLPHHLISGAYDMLGAAVQDLIKLKRAGSVPG